MAINLADFTKIWASTSPLTPYSFTDANYQEGWNFVGSTPPSRQMWDSIQKLNDEKAQWLYLNVVQGIPIGVVQAYAGNTVPDGWLLCDGSAVSRTDYADLYSVIGDSYGAGDGSTTFNLPNLVEKFIEGSATAGTEKSAGLPNILGMSQTSLAVWNNSANQDDTFESGALKGVVTGNKWNQGSGGTRNFATYYFDASKSNSIYGNSATVQPPALTMQYVIKY